MATTLKTHFEYLDDLRESGRTNMYGAATYLTDECGVPRDEARKILKAWMKTFDGNTPLDERVRQAEAV